MIGFKRTFTSLEAKNHRDKLISQVPSHYVEEINQIYDWMTDDIFLSALENQTIEQWEYCKRAMKNPPLVFIDDCIKKCNQRQLFKVSYPKPIVPEPRCKLCNFSLAKSTREKIDFCVLSCHCGNLYCHTKCMENYIKKSESCYLCKQYYLLETKHCPLITMIEDH